MTPKQKADKILNTFDGLEGITDWDTVKKCAIITIFEILNITSTKESWFNVKGRYEERKLLNPYWVEVKDEIEKQ
jgi:hypothetical protein